MEYIKIENNLVVELISTSDKMDAPWVPVKLEGGINTGADVRLYDADWNLRPIADCVAEGLIELLVATEEHKPYAVGTVLEKVADNEIVRKSDAELAVEGARPLEEFEKIEDGVLVHLSMYEIFNEGIQVKPDDIYLDHENKVAVHSSEVEELYANGEVSDAVLEAYQIDCKRTEILMAISEVDQLATNPIIWGDLSVDEQNELIAYRKELVAMKNGEVLADSQLPTKPVCLSA